MTINSRVLSTFRPLPSFFRSHKKGTLLGDYLPFRNFVPICQQDPSVPQASGDSFCTPAVVIAIVSVCLRVMPPLDYTPQKNGPKTQLER